MAAKTDMKKPIKFFIITVTLVLVGYNSVYFESLDVKNTAKNAGVFNSVEFVDQFMGAKLPNLPATDANELIGSLELDLVGFTAENGRKMGISNDYYFVVEGTGEVQAIEDEDVILSLIGNSKNKIRIATDFIFGNTIREATAIANIGDFQNTMDFNAISVALNDKVRTTIVPSFSKEVNIKDTVYFKGGVKVNTKNPTLKNLRVIPLILNIE
ncbi:DUF2291 family protein [Maribacter sedimenticola]|nr:DUF2291 family protein [Maribacter sedimenticola]